MMIKPIHRSPVNSTKSSVNGKKFAGSLPLSSAAWNSHAWISGLSMGSGVPLNRHLCRRCGCVFVEDVANNRRYPAQISDSPFRNLMREPRWLIEPCLEEKAEKAR
jgi:hypothetical protein